MLAAELLLTKPDAPANRLSAPGGHSEAELVKGAFGLIGPLDIKLLVRF